MEFSFLEVKFNIFRYGDDGTWHNAVNAAGVYYLFDHLVDFFNNIEIENRLLVALHWDLKVLTYKVDSRALGLIEKLITGPL